MNCKEKNKSLINSTVTARVKAKKSQQHLYFHLLIELPVDKHVDIQQIYTNSAIY